MSGISAPSAVGSSLSTALGLLLLAAMASALTSRVIATERLPAETFARDYAYENVALSPDGQQLAVSFLAKGSTNLAVIDLATNKAVAVTGIASPDSLAFFGWKSKDRLIYETKRHDEYVRGFSVWRAVSPNGRNRVDLNHNPQPGRRYTYEYLLDWQREDPNSVLVVAETEKLNYPTVYRVNINRITPQNSRSGNDGRALYPTARQRLFVPPGRDCNYMVDLQGVVRTCMTREADNTARLLYRSGESGKWVELGHFVSDAALVIPLAFAPDNRQMYVLSNLERDTVALYLYDAENDAFGDLLFESEGVDVAGGIRGADERRLLGVNYFRNGMGIHYLDPEVLEIHLAMNKLFPGLQVQPVSFSEKNDRVVLRVSGASTPGSYYVYERESNKVRKVADIAPWIDANEMGRVRAITFKARDGLALNGYLTLPRDKPEKNLPLIVNVHGGPIGIRDFAQFDRESQLFANRGYAVLQVNFRGSGGFGRAFTQAGAGEWGGKMQTDILDGVEYLIKKGIVDRDRVGIFGGSYGGYAAMMALVRSPELFKCGITYAGVSNLEAMLSRRAMYTSAGIKRRVGRSETQFWETVIGQRRDAARLREISPLYNVEKIKAPVLIAHGTDDLTVPVAEATDLHKALREAGKQVEAFIVPREGHGFSVEKNRAKFYRRVDEFLGKYLPAQ